MPTHQNKVFTAPRNGIVPPLRRLLILAVLTVALATRVFAGPSTVVTDSELISGFELSVNTTTGGGGPYESASVLQKGIYWWDGPGICSGERLHSGKIYLRGTVSSATKLLHNSCYILQEPVYNVVRDDAYIYYFSDGQIKRKAVNAPSGASAATVSTSPETPTLVDELSTFLELSNDRLHWGKYMASLGWVLVYSMKTDGSEAPQTIAAILDAGAPVRKLKPFTYVNSSGATVDAVAVLLTNGKLYRWNITAGISALVATGVSDFAVHTVSSFIGSSTRIYAAIGIVGSSVPPNIPPSALRKINPDDGSFTTIFEAAGANQIVSVTTDSDMFFNIFGPSVGKNIYLTENVVMCSGPCNVSDARIYRHAFPISDPIDRTSWDLIVPIEGGANLRSDDRWLYFLRATTIQRIPTGAPAVQIDLAADRLEVVQASQDLNQSVRLVADKKTFVRGYAHFTADTSGATAPWIPKATLEAYRGTTLIGKISPSPSSGGGVTTDGNLDTLRSSLGTSFLFQLPDAWVTRGDLQLLMNLNDDGVIPETGSALNYVSAGPVHFGRGIQPCLVVSPLHTRAPLYEPSDAPGFRFGAILDRATSLLPIDRYGFGWKEDSNPISKKVLVPKLCLCLPPIKLIEYRPFNLDADDLQLALDSVAWRAWWSKDPTGFDSVHYIGAVHETHSSTFNGKGQRPGQSVIARMQTGSNGLTLPWLLPWGGVNLAHELGHNLNRKHINQTVSFCPGQLPAGPFETLPPGMDPCTLGPVTGLPAVFGFDALTQTPIAPTAAADMMSYASSVWISRFNWEVLFPDRGFAQASPTKLGPVGDPSGPLLLIHARINLMANRAELDPSYGLPPGVADPLRVAQSFGAAAQLPANFPFKIRLLDGGGLILDQTPCVLVPSGDEEQDNTFGLTQVVPFDPATRLIQIVRDNVVLVERLRSGNAPVVTLAPPVVDAVNETLSLNWNASDADNDYLLFTVQYSNDDGATWTALDADYPFLAMTVGTRSLPGSPVARVRVIATDGVNSAVAVSGPFALSRHAPKLEIAGVREAALVAFGGSEELRALVQDAEDLSRPSANVFWNLTGPASRTGAGPHVSLAELSPGSYSATATVGDSDNNVVSATRSFEVQPLTIREAATPVLDGLAHDAAYANATSVRIPVGGDEFARARLVHSGSNLFVCFSDLQLPAPGSTRNIGLRVDTNGSRDLFGSAGDIGFFVDSDGIPFQEAGTGSGMAVTLTPQLGFTAVIQLGSNGWSAEFRIAESLLGGWNHAAGIMLDHDSAHWPPLADNNRPATWSPAYFGATLPQSPNRPPFARTGARQIINVASATTVVLDGSGSFDPDGDPLTYRWMQIAGPAVSLVITSTVSPSFIVNPVAAATTLRFRLVVNDGSFDSAPAETDVTLEPTPIQDLPDLPLSSQARFVNGAFQFRMIGAPGSQYSIQTSSNLVGWQTVQMGTVDFYGLVDFIDRAAAGFSARFYRLAPAATNDNFASAIPLSGNFVSVSTANFLATKEPFEPNHAGNPGGKSLWWSWTASAPGTVTISTIGSSFDTVLAVYVGSLPQLGLIAADEDSGGNLTSRVTFDAQPNFTYHIAVDGHDGAAGNIQLNITTP